MRCFALFRSTAALTVVCAHLQFHPTSVAQAAPESLPHTSTTLVALPQPSAMAPEAPTFDLGPYVFSEAAGVARTRMFHVRSDGEINTEFRAGEGFVSLHSEGWVRAWLDPQDRLLVFFESSRRVFRYLPDGDLDPSFIAEAEWPGWLEEVLFQRDGKIVVGVAGRVYRLLESGLRDSSFNERPDTWIVGPFSDERLLVTEKSGLRILLSDGTLDPDFSFSEYDAAIDMWDHVYLRTQGEEELIRLKADGSLDESFAPAFKQPCCLRRGRDGRVSATGIMNGQYGRVFFDKEGNGTVGPYDAREILEDSMTGIELHTGSAWVFGPQGGLIWLSVSATLGNTTIERALWSCGNTPLQPSETRIEGPCSTADWVPLGSGSVLGAVGDQLIRVSINDRGVSPRFARDHAITTVSAPRVLIWRANDPSIEEAVQYTVSSPGSSEGYQNTVIFPPANPKSGSICPTPPVQANIT